MVEPQAWPVALALVVMAARAMALMVALVAVGDISVAAVAGATSKFMKAAPMVAEALGTPKLAPLLCQRRGQVTMDRGMVQH